MLIKIMWYNYYVIICFMVINCWLLMIFNMGKCILMFLNKDICIFFFLSLKKEKLLCVYIYFFIKDLYIKCI